MVTVTKTITVTVPNPDYDPTLSPGDPDYEPPTIEEQQVLTRDKPVMVGGTVGWVTVAGWFNDATVSPPAPGAQDTSNNLTSQTTYMRPSVSGPTASFGSEGFAVSGDTGEYANDPADSINLWGTASISLGSPSYSYSGGVGGFSGTRKSDGANASSSPANHYSRGTIEAWSWSAGWSITVSGSLSASFVNQLVVPDNDYDSNSPGISIPYTESLGVSSSASTSGGVSGCSRTLVVAPPNCKIDGTGSSPYGWVFNKTETFSSHGNHGRPTRVYDVGPNRRSQVTLANFHNPFSLRSGDPTFSYDNGLQGKSTNVASVMQSHMNGAVYPFYFTVAAEGIGAAYSTVPQHSHPSTNAINTPGRYRVTWIPKWKTAANSLDGIWNGSELSSETCKYDGTPADPLEGAQSHPAQNALVTRLGLNIWVHAEPPTCSVDEFLFEVNDPPTSRITLFNPNRAPMDVGRSELTISRGGYSQTNSAGSHVIAAASMDGLGNVLAAGEEIIDKTADPISFSGQFTALWSIGVNMGGEIWTSEDNNAGQNSWFQDPNERIIDNSLASRLCESTTSKIVYLPFIKVFYGGLAAGGQFGTGSSYTSCGQGFEDALGGDRTVAAFAAGHAEVTGGGDVRGSSVEYALQANNIIGGFYSASQRVVLPVPLKGLTFANNDIFHGYGGNFGRKTCITNYWREVEKLELSAKPSPLTLDLKTELNERRRYELPAGEQLELSASGALDGLKATLYVEGDVLIKQDIVSVGGPWYDPSQIGYLSIIVKGNIDIAPNVDRIDALLVAYPKLDSSNDVVDGRIRTCWDPVLTDPASPPDIHFHTCDRQLVINGALIAEKVLFGRVHASVKHETDYPTQPKIARADNPNSDFLNGPIILAHQGHGNSGGFWPGLYPDCSELDSGKLEIIWSRSHEIPMHGYNYYVKGPGNWQKSGRVWHADNIVFTDAPGPGRYEIFVGAEQWGTSGDWRCPPIINEESEPVITAISTSYLQFETHFSGIELECYVNGGIGVRAWGRRWWSTLGGFWGPQAIEISVSGRPTYQNPTGRADGMYDPSLYSGLSFINNLPGGPVYRVSAADHSHRNKARISQSITCDGPGIGTPTITRIVPPIEVVRPPGLIPPGELPLLPPILPEATAAAEIINLLPEYLIGIPELPLFGDQFYKTDSFSILPVNF